MAIMYICDKKKYCNTADVCGKECKHTADREHALYRTHQRFIKIENNSWEQDPNEENDDGTAVE